MFSNWLCNGIHCIPTMLEALADGRLLYPINMAPLGQGFGHAMNTYNVVTPLVIHLLIAVGPSAVILGVITIIINAINRVFGAYTRVSRDWPISHVGIKSLKRIDPARAHGYSSSTIFKPVSILRVGAALFNSGPCLVLRRLYHTVNKIEFTGLLQVIAPTRYCAARFNMRSPRYMGLTARTLEQPLIVCRSLNMGNGSEPIESFTRYIITHGVSPLPIN